MFTRTEVTLMIAAVIIWAWCFRADAVEPNNNYIYTTGLTCYAPAAVKGCEGRLVHLVGFIIGGGKGFYDLKALDGYGVRISWTFDKRLPRDQKLTIIGRLDKPGHIDATGVKE